MKKTIILLLIVITGCTEIDSEIDFPEINNELSVELNANSTEGEIPLKVQSLCSASGGIGNYTYTWFINGDAIDCSSSECSLASEEPGNHTVLCRVSSGDQTEEDSLIIEALKQRKKVDMIISLGDSLTYGHGLNDTEKSWPFIYAKDFKEADVLNTATSGATTFNVIEEQLPMIRNEDGFKLIFLWIGINDAKKLFDQDIFRENYEQIVNNLSRIPNSELYLINIPDATKLEIADDIDEDINELIAGLGFNIRIDTKTTARSIISSYNDIIEDIAEQNNLSVIDMFSYLERYNETWIAEDRFHPNEYGHELIEKKIDDMIEEERETTILV